MKLLGWISLALWAASTTWAQAQGLQGPARAAALATLQADERRALFTDVSRIFYSEGQQLALAFLYSGVGTTSSFDLKVVVLRREGAGYSLVGQPQIFGSNPRNVRFSPGKIDVTTTMPRPGDPRCCPTGTRTWTINSVPIVSASTAPLAPSDATGASSVAPSGGTLGRRWCSEDGYVEFRNGTLMMEVAGNEATYRGVKFAGCQGMRCTYTQGSARWVSTRQGAQVSVTGPVALSGGNNRDSMITTATFGPCR
jgi:hypothetical protein